MANFLGLVSVVFSFLVSNFFEFVLSRGSSPALFSFSVLSLVLCDFLGLSVESLAVLCFALWAESLFAFERVDLSRAARGLISCFLGLDGPGNSICGGGIADIEPLLFLLFVRLRSPGDLFLGVTIEAEELRFLGRSDAVASCVTETSAISAQMEEAADLPDPRRSG